jgi:hypothetical protein
LGSVLCQPTTVQVYFVWDGKEIPVIGPGT